MKEHAKLNFLLGANAPTGFAGYFEQLVQPRPGWRYLLIKAGPGCGKSTLMKKMAAHFSAQGAQVELIHCSSDPDSLDGVVCPGRKFCILDATAPHTLEPKYPGAVETVVPLYQCLDEEQLRQNQAQIVELFGRCSHLQERATRYITAAGSLLQDSARVAFAAADLPAARAFARHLAKKYLPQPPKAAQPPAPGQESLRLLSANTLKGPLCYDATIADSASVIVVLQDDWGAVSRAMMRVLREEILARGLDLTTCYCPFAPHDKIDHLLVPAAGLAFVTSNRFHPLRFEGARVIHCTRFCDKAQLRSHRSRLNFNRKAIAVLLGQASGLQAEAKRFHDQLEEYYKSAADFVQIDLITQELIKKYG